MKNLLFVLICLLTLCIDSGAQHNLASVSVTDSIPIKKLRIDPNYAYGGRASQIFDTVIFTPLETRKDVVVGYTHNLQVSKHYFVFYDQDLHGLYVFDKSGKYISSITKLPLNNWHPSEDGGMFYNFYLDKKSERIFVNYNDKSKDNNKWLAIFSPSGTLIKSRQLPNLIKNMQFKYLDLDSTGMHTSIIAYYQDPLEKPDTVLNKYGFYLIQNFDTITRRMLKNSPSEILNKSRWMKYYSSSQVNNGNVLWYRNFDYTVIHTNKEGEIEKLQVLFPLSMSIDSSFYKDTSLLASFDKSFAYFNGKNNVIMFLQNGMLSDNKWFLFDAQNRTYPTPQLMYNLDSRKLLDFNKISSDSMSYFLPIKSWQLGSVADNSIYNMIPAFEFFQTQSARDDAPWNKNPVLEKYFKTENRKSNPIIVELKLKSKL